MIVKQTSNVVASVLEHLMNILSLFIVYRLIITELGMDLLGLWSLIGAIFSLTNIGSAGFASSTLKFVAKYNAHNDNDSVTKTIETSLITVFITTALTLLLITLVVKIFPNIFLNQQEYNIINPIIPWVIISLFIAILGRVYLSALDGLNSIVYRSYIGIISKFFFLGSSVYLIGRMGLKGLAIANFIQYLVVLIMAFFFLKNKCHDLKLVLLRFDKRLFIDIFRYGYQFQISSVFQMLIDPVAKFFLKDFGGLVSVGNFEVVYKFFLQARQLIVVVLNVLVPTIAKLKEVAPDQVIKLFKKTISTTVIISSLLFALTFVLLPGLLDIVDIDMDFTILMYSVYIYFGLLANLIGITPYMFNLGTGDLKDNTLTSGIMAITCCLFSFIFGKIWQAHGVVIAWSFSQILSNVILIILFFRKEKLHLSTLLQKESLILTILNLMFVTICSMVIVVAKYNTFISLSAGLSICIIYTLINYYLFDGVSVLFRQLISLKNFKVIGRHIK